MAAVMRIDVDGVGVGTDGIARSDGVSGSLVTVTSVGAGTSHDLVLWTTNDPAPPSLTMNSATEWEFTPNSGDGYTYVLRLTVDAVESYRTLRILTTNLGFAIPAPNEAADPDASLVNNGAAVVEASFDNEGGNYWGWQPAMDEWLRELDTWAAPGGDLGGTMPNPTVTDLTITGESQGSVLYFDGSNWVRLAPGTSGQYLQTLGAAANPQWAAGAGGSLDDAYDFGGAGAGRTITADSGAVVITGTGVVLDVAGGGNAVVSGAMAGGVAAAAGLDIWSTTNATRGVITLEAPTTSNADVTLRLAGGDATNQTRGVLLYDSSADRLDFSSYQDTAGNGTYVSANTTLSIGHDGGSTTDTRASQFTLYANDGTLRTWNTFLDNDGTVLYFGLNTSSITWTGFTHWSVGGGEGTSGQVLTSNGTGASPTWEDAAGGGGGVSDLQGAYDGGNSILLAGGNGVDITHAVAAGTNHAALRVLYSASTYTAAPSGLLVSWAGATGLNSGSDVYGVQLVGEANAGAGDSVGLNIDSTWDVGLQVDNTAFIEEQLFVGGTFASINYDASAAVEENPALALLGGDGVAATNDDIVSTILQQMSADEYVHMYMQRDRNGGGAATIRPVFQVGALETGDQDAEFWLAGGDGTNQTRHRTHYDASANVWSSWFLEDAAGDNNFAEIGGVWNFGSPGQTANIEMELSLNGGTSSVSAAPLRLRAGTNSTGLAIIMCPTSASTGGLAFQSASGGEVMSLDPQNRYLNVGTGVTNARIRVGAGVSNNNVYLSATPGGLGLYVEKAAAGTDPQIWIRGGASKDAALMFDRNSAAAPWRMGLDVTTDQFAISSSTTLGTSDRLILGQDGSTSNGFASSLHGGHANGADMTGGNVNLYPGQGTGQGAGGGTHMYVAPAAVSTGSGANAYEVAMSVTSFGVADTFAGYPTVTVCPGATLSNPPNFPTLFQVFDPRGNIAFNMFRLVGETDSEVSQGFWRDAASSEDVRGWSIGMPDDSTLVTPFTFAASGSLSGDDDHRFWIGWANEGIGHLADGAFDRDVDHTADYQTEFELVAGSTSNQLAWALDLPTDTIVQIHLTYTALKTAAVGTNIWGVTDTGYENVGGTVALIGTPQTYGQGDTGDLDLGFTISGTEVRLLATNISAGTARYKFVIRYSMMGIGA